MTLTMRDAHRHADRILELVRSGRPELGSDVVAQSWGRCINEYRLHPARPHDPVFINRVELEERRARRADVIACARYEMTTLYQQLADVETAVVLTDTDGVIVHMVSSPEFAAEVGPLGLRVGGKWSETDAGTNGMGTCLAAGGPVSVRREDHFYTQFTQLTCSAVPVYDPSGEIAAVLDVTSRSSLMQQHLLVLLGMTARMIENRLIDARYRNAHPLHFHSRPEFVYTLHEGKLAVGDDGRILAANRSALFQLGLQSMEDIRSRRIEDLFQTSLEDMLQRSMSSSFHPVVTYRANAALRFFAVARRPASDAKSPLALASSQTAEIAPMPMPTPQRAPARPVAARAAGGGSASIFKDPRLVAHLDTARRVIARQTPVLLCGETGSGKEVFARAVHEASPHAGGAFVAVNCASLPETLIESELFGYRAGAFTGAQRTGRRGKILQADGGTLFLDEIADMPLELQARLLRVLDERQVTPLGTEETHAVDFQLISASHQHLPQRVREGRFREDLYYRLAGIELLLPPLRERSDRRDLITHVLASESGGAGSLSAEAERLLLEHAWPGNLRQLRHVLRSAAALADGRPITREHLPSLLHAAAPGPLPVAPAALARPAATAAEPAPETALPVKLNPIQANERQVLLQLLEQHRWNVSNVAKALDVSRNTLYRKLHKLHIEVSHPE
jgi:transcriptional regulator of acetoin/glycerol metabolism